MAGRVLKWEMGMIFEISRRETSEEEMVEATLTHPYHLFRSLQAT